MRNGTLLAWAILLTLLGCIGAVAIGVWFGGEAAATKPEQAKCTRTYDRRDAPGSITITWDRPCRKV